MGWIWGIIGIFGIGLVALILALCKAQEQIPPEEEMRLIREQAEERRRKSERKRVKL